MEVTALTGANAALKEGAAVGFVGVGAAAHSVGCNVVALGAEQLIDTGDSGAPGAPGVASISYSSAIGRIRHTFLFAFSTGFETNRTMLVWPLQKDEI